MSNGMILKIKRLFLNQPYIAHFPLSNKSDEEKKALVTAFNSCDPNEDSDVSMLLSSLYGYALNKISNTRLDKENIERNLRYSYKTKKHKSKDKETGEKTVTKSTVEKRGAKRVIETFQNRKEKNIKETERYENLLQAFENCALTIEHLPLCDELLKENKYKKWIYKVLVITVITAPILVFILARVFHI